MKKPVFSVYFFRTSRLQLPQGTPTVTAVHNVARKSLKNWLRKVNIKYPVEHNANSRFYTETKQFQATTQSTHVFRAKAHFFSQCFRGRSWNVFSRVMWAPPDALSKGEESVFVFFRLEFGIPYGPKYPNNKRPNIWRTKKETPFVNRRTRVQQKNQDTSPFKTAWTSDSSEMINFSLNQLLSTLLCYVVVNPFDLIMV